MSASTIVTLIFFAVLLSIAAAFVFYVGTNNTSSRFLLFFVSSVLGSLSLSMYIALGAYIGGVLAKK